MKKILLILLLLLFHAQTFAAEPFVIAVMDPLAKELACDCVAGFAQRDYKALTDRLRIVDANRFSGMELVFASSLQAAIIKSSPKRVDMIIGKDSVVRHELQQAKIPAKAIARLTDQEGSTDFTGLVIVAADDPANSVADLKKHKLLLGPPDSDEKHAAAIKLFAEHGISIPEKPDTIDKCTEAGFAIIENESEQPIATVVSDYALVLIEGCQTIEKGALRVLDKTEPVPFISVFVTTTVDTETLETLYTVLSTLEPKQLKALESKDGFVPYRSDQDKAPWDLVAVEEPEGNSKN
jgi:ABC-type phosphate/phosphonate transport system substrate-binding protein